MPSGCTRLSAWIWISNQPRHRHLAVYRTTNKTHSHHQQMLCSTLESQPHYSCACTMCLHLHQPHPLPSSPHSSHLYPAQFHRFEAQCMRCKPAHESAINRHTCSPSLKRSHRHPSIPQMMVQCQVLHGASADAFIYVLWTTSCDCFDGVSRALLPKPTCNPKTEAEPKSEPKPKHKPNWPDERAWHV